ncbi:MAG TPA: hypothetical protein DCR61_10530 [Verrucomicrobiales bacterium]|nr:hypothetical protein [Verrucomicrobiales bacterium]HCP36491.1 hypothetical protein [Verrucomicrobiales bacterium]
MKILALIVGCSNCWIITQNSKKMKNLYLLKVSFCAFLMTLYPGASAQNSVLNPSFEFNYPETWPHYGEVEEWQGGSGVNQVDGPFHNGGTPVPDQARAAFIQGSASLDQEVFGFEPGASHWLQFYYDARACCGGTIDLVISLDDVELDRINNVKSSTDGNPYKFRNIPFVPEFDAGVLTFQTIAAGDATLNLDAISFVVRGENEVPVMNPSFEASGEPFSPDGIISPANIAGWVGEGTYGVNIDGLGPFGDNGRTSESDFVGFISGVGSLTQTLDSLVVGNDYRLTFEYNARTGDNPQLTVMLGEEQVYQESVKPVGSENAYRTASISFTADDVQIPLSFQQTKDGDHTILLDAIRLEGEVGQSFLPVQIVPMALELAPSQTGEVTVTLPEAYLAIKGGQMTLTSPDPGIASFVGADENGTLTLDFEKGGENVKTVEIVGRFRGAVRMLINPPDGLELTNDTAVNVVSSIVRNASFESNEAPGGVGIGSIVSWNGGTGLNLATGPFHDNGVIPDRRQVAVLQGSQSLSQEIEGLMPGESYWIQFNYNARDCCGGTIGLSVQYNGEALWSIEDVLPASADGLETYYFQNVSFTPSSSGGLLEFVTTAEGDATILLDAVNILSRGKEEIVIRNPSFEASGSPMGVGYVQPSNLAGWEFSAGGRGVNVTGRGPFADNGSGLDQDSVLFIQNAATMSQLVEGFEAGATYTLYYYVNARNCCGDGFTAYSVSFDEEVLIDEEVIPAGGNLPFHLRYVTFVPSFQDGILQFDAAPEGDHTLLLDDIHIVKGNFVPPTPQPPDVTITFQRLEGEGIELSWPSAASDLILQRAETIEGEWSDIDEPVVPVNDQNTVTILSKGNQAYFRLWAP